MFKVNIMQIQSYPDLGINAEHASKIVDFATGSRFKQKSLCIIIGDINEFHISHLVAALQ